MDDHVEPARPPGGSTEDESPLHGELEGDAAHRFPETPSDARAAGPEEYRWRPAVAPFRTRGLPRSKPRRPLPGQMLLPGIESGEPSHRTTDDSENEPPPVDPVGVSERSPPAAAVERGPVCPNCGAAEFDEDGDCTSCWEPGVMPADARPRPE
ncbi:MAG: hypothetical protein ACYTG0_09255 [Planctomycetota bacterium]